jgi:citrate lyase beta subunit
MKVSLKPSKVQKMLGLLDGARVEFDSLYPGTSNQRQPVHTVYGGAHLYKAETTAKLGKLAFKALTDYAPAALVFADALGLRESSDLSESLCDTVYELVKEKLAREAVEDFRIDFEDGYGNRADSEEDGHAESTAREVARAMKDGALPPFFGIRVKPLDAECRWRSVRTLDIFLTTLMAEAGALPDNFVITLPKVAIAEQVACFVALLDELESSCRLPQGALKIEIMIEQSQALFNHNGALNIPALVNAAAGRCRGVHFGAFDYTAACDIVSSQQRLDHPACDFARQVMLVSLAGTGIWLSDGATNVMPVGPHRVAKDSELTAKQQDENKEVVQRAWKIAYQNNRRSLAAGFYQGWDLHPAQLIARYAACYSFFLEELEPATGRLKAFIEKAAQANLVGAVFDDAATGQGLLNFFLRAISCGAISHDEIRATGLSIEEIQSKSFRKILESRRT